MNNRWIDIFLKALLVIYVLLIICGIGWLGLYILRSFGLI